jgi:benzoylformate decarboxylase
MKGRFAILEQFKTDGFRFMFGNPGTSEQGFLDALSDYRADLQYVLALQESVAVMMADGYARATGHTALVQIHSTPGLGNSIGALYQAYRGHSPLVVIGGDAGLRYMAMDSQMAGDLVGMAKPVTKWSAMVWDASSLLRMLRRAIRIASTPPKGPVYLCLPMDILDADVTEEIRPTDHISTQSLPPRNLLAPAAAALAASQRPIFFVGDGVAFSGAQPELEKLAELVGAEVWGADVGDLNMNLRHPLWQGMAGHMFGYDSLSITKRGDFILICGTYMLPEVFPELGDIYSPGAKVLHIDLNTYEIGKNHRVDWGFAADPKGALALLAENLERDMTLAQKETAAHRASRIGSEKLARLNRAKEEDRNQRGAFPLRFSTFMEELAARLPEDTLVFDEALTSSPELTRYLAPCRPRHYFLSRGGSLGVGVPGAIGAKLAHPQKTVIGFTGDGGLMYTHQALWTAARYQVDVKFVVCNNHSYRLLDLNLQAYWRERSLPERPMPECFSLANPPMNFVEMARALGIEGSRVERADQAAPEIEKALRHRGPYLLDVSIGGV